MAKDEVPADARKTKEYFSGKAAFSPDSTLDDCPHPEGKFSMKRIAWLCGFLDARTNHRLGHIFKKYGIAHPDAEAIHA